jgi:hypothetical protein
LKDPAPQRWRTWVGDPIVVLLPSQREDVGDAGLEDEYRVGDLRLGHVWLILSWFVLRRPEAFVLGKAD